MKKRIIWYNYIKLMGVSLIFVILGMIYIYMSSMSITKGQFMQINEQKTNILANNFKSIIVQTERIATSLCIDQDAYVFCGYEDPENVNKDVYTRLRGKLKTYKYSIEYIAAITLFSPEYERVLNETTQMIMDAPGIQSTDAIDIDWYDEYKKMCEKKEFTRIWTRSIHNNYPHVLTILKRYVSSGTERVIVMDLNLKKLYSFIWTEESSDTEIYAIDSDGQIIICREKKALYQDTKDDNELNKHFKLDKQRYSYLDTDNEIPITFTKQYLDEYQLYLVSITELKDYHSQIANEQHKIINIFIVCCFLLSIIVLMYCTASYKPFQSILDILTNPKEIQEKEMDLQIQEIVELIISHVQTNEKLHEELDSKLGILRETQAQALQAQFNPHFLFNSLNVICAVAQRHENDDGEVTKLSKSLMSILKYSLAKPELVNLESELEYLEKYVYIMQTRYYGSFEVKFEFDKTVMDAMVPRLILQPLIENAIFHGIAARDEEAGGMLSLRGRTDIYNFDEKEVEEVICIEVEDNGYGMTEEEIEKQMAGLHDMGNISTQHIGLQNVAKRLYLLYPGRVDVNIRSQRGEGTCITLVFPKQSGVDKIV